MGLVFSMFASCFCGTIQSAGSSRPIVSTFRHFKVILSPIKPLKFYILPILNALMSGPINYLTLNLPPRMVLDIWLKLPGSIFLILKDEINKAQYLYLFRASYDASYNTSQTFCFKTQSSQNKTSEKPRTRL